MSLCNIWIKKKHSFEQNFLFEFSPSLFQEEKISPALLTTTPLPESESN